MNVVPILSMKSEPRYAHLLNISCLLLSLSIQPQLPSSNLEIKLDLDPGALYYGFSPITKL